MEFKQGRHKITHLNLAMAASAADVCGAWKKIFIYTLEFCDFIFFLASNISQTVILSLRPGKNQCEQRLQLRDTDTCAQDKCVSVPDGSMMLREASRSKRCKCGNLRFSGFLIGYNGIFYFYFHSLEPESLRCQTVRLNACCFAK